MAYFQNKISITEQSVFPVIDPWGTIMGLYVHPDVVGLTPDLDSLWIKVEGLLTEPGLMFVRDIGTGPIPVYAFVVPEREWRDNWTPVQRCARAFDIDNFFESANKWIRFSNDMVETQAKSYIERLLGGEQILLTAPITVGSKLDELSEVERQAMLSDEAIAYPPESNLRLDWQSGPQIIVQQGAGMPKFVSEADVVFDLPGPASTFTVAHDLNTRELSIALYTSSNLELSPIVEVAYVDDNTITLTLPQQMQSLYVALRKNPI